MAVRYTTFVNAALVEAYGIATSKNHEFITPEHLLAGFLRNTDFWEAVTSCGRAEELESGLYEYINSLEEVTDRKISVEFSYQLKEVFTLSSLAAESSSNQMIRTHHVMFSIFQLEDSQARFLLENCLDCGVPEFLNSLLSYTEEEDEAEPERWRRFLNEMDTKEGFVGREEEIGQIMRTLCRMKKANVLIVGGRGVGKTATARETARLIDDRNAWNRDSELSREMGLTGGIEVPVKLQGMHVMELDTTLLLGGAQYRGDLEMRIRELMEGIIEDGKTIIYIDDLRSLGGGNRNDDGSKDILSILTPYLKSGEVRCMISATYEDIKRIENLSPGALGAFCRVELDEPDKEETFEIIKKGVLADLQKAHGVRYPDEICRSAIEKSIRHISDRCLPEKAIDLLDQAGAYAGAVKIKEVSINSISVALKDICRADVSVNQANEDLFSMESHLKERIYGQDMAIKTITEAILMSKAGLTDAAKPIGSFLFVGPTGVGKTELSKVLAEQLQVPLHRFDMSEYSEKHSVAKLIGSPAGYVGYDDGGILTDAIRKNPYCVLLLDEIEKAHEDIYNLLLQVMDYAVISDNKGRKVDFRNVVLIMTSNAGARYAHKAAVGFERKANAGEAMAKEVKSVFAPEFINRLSSVVVFNDMDETMAGLILDRKIDDIRKRLQGRDIRLTIEPAAYTRLLEEGFSKEYGAREIERVLNARVTPLLMKEILFGKHKEGFTATVSVSGNEYILSV